MIRWVVILATVTVLVGAARGESRVAQAPPPAEGAEVLPTPSNEVALASFKEGNAAYRRAAASTDPAIQRTSYHDAARHYLAAVKIETKHHYTLYWNLAQTYRLLGEYTRATHFYKKFLEFAPARFPVHRTGAEDHIRTMAAELDKEEALREQDKDRASPGEGTKPLAPAVGVQARDSVDGQGRPRWYADKVGWSLVGTGVVASAVGAGFFQNSSSLFDQAADEDRQSVQADLEERARLRRGVGVATGVAGIALLAAGVIKLSVNGAPQEGAPGVGVTISASSISVYGSF